VNKFGLAASMQLGFNAKAQRHSAAGRNPIFTTKAKITKKNRPICHIRYFVSFVRFVVKKFCQK
jgi:hypothetical protein